MMLSLLLTAAVAIGQAPPAPVVLPTAELSSPAPREAALTLARLLNSEASIIGDGDDDTKVVSLIRQLAEGEPELVSLEREHPGLMKAMASAILPIINRSERERLPELQRRQAILYGSTFNDADLMTLTQFYSSPTGQKLIAIMNDAIRPNAMLAEMTASPDLKISPASVLKDIAAVKPELAKQMTAEDQEILKAFGRSGLIPRIEAVAPETQAIALAWYDENAPWEEAETEKALASVLNEFGIGDDE